MIRPRTPGQLKHPWTIDALIWAIEHPLREQRTNFTVGDEETGRSPEIEIDAVDYLYDALRAMGDVAANKMLLMLRPKDPRCFAAIETLRQMKESRAIPRLFVILQQGELPLRVAAAEGLAALHWRPTNSAEVQARQLADHLGHHRWKNVMAFGSAAVQCATVCLRTH